MTAAACPQGTARRRYLLVVRVGDSSLHPTWTLGPDGAAHERTFDLAVDYYGSTPGRWAGTAEHYTESRGSKWRGLHRLLAANPSWLTDYDAVWFPDDDIATDAATIDAMFALHADLGLGLSQPSLTADSYFTHLMTLSHPGFAVRVTNFVEVMVPVFSRAALQACWSTFDESESGYGLDLAWQGIVPGLGLKSGILDCVSVRHTRPLGSGSLYDGMTEPPHREGARVARAHGMPTPFPFAVLEALDDQLQALTGLEAERRIAATPPQPTVQEVPAWDLYLGEVRDRVRATAALDPRAAPAVTPLPETGLVRPLPPVAPRQVRADLSHLDEDAPLALVVADDGLDVVLAWRAAGWQTVVLPTRDAELLADHLAHAERFPARALDVAGAAARELEVAAGLGARVGAYVVVRPAPSALTCGHQVPTAVRSALGGCTACPGEWGRVAASAAAVVIPDAASAQPLAAFGIDPALLTTAPVLPAAPAAPALQRDLAVVVFASREPAATAAALSALAAQRGLGEPLEVVVVPATSSVPAPRLAPTTGALSVSTAPVAGPAGFAAAVRAVRAPRVLVLDASDAPGPWCVHDHAAAAARPGAPEVVVSGGRTSLLLVDDPWTEAVHACGPTQALSQRTSVRTDLAREVAGVRAIASATSATAVLTSGRPVGQVTAPTHTGLAFTDLDAHIRSTLLAALSGAVVGVGAIPPGLQAELTHWSHSGPRLVDLARQLTPIPGPLLREAVANWVTGERGCDVVTAVVQEVQSAHWAAGVLAVGAARSAGRSSRPVVISVAARDERLVQLVQLLAGGALSPRAFRVLVVLDPRAGDERGYAQDFLTQVGAAGVGIEALPDVQVVVSDEPATRRLDAQVTLPVDGAAWSPGLPVPLLGLSLPAWLSYLDLAHLLERPSRDLSTTHAQGAPC